MAPHYAEEEDDWDDDADDDCTMPCPYCGRSIHEDSVRCPHCEKYLSEEDRPDVLKPWWLIVAAVVCLLAVLTWILGMVM
jgi:uncharacterized paraquat-inducible protein A